jgi:PII-like signaling protein
MTLLGHAQKLKIIIGERDMVYDHPLYEAIALAASKFGMAGITVTHGLSGFGAAAYQSPPMISTVERPVIIEAVDAPGRIGQFSEIVKRLFDKAGCNGIIYVENVEVLHYRRRD